MAFSSKFHSSFDCFQLLRLLSDLFVLASVSLGQLSGPKFSNRKRFSIGSFKSHNGQIIRTNLGV